MPPKTSGKPDKKEGKSQKNNFKANNKKKLIRKQSNANYICGVLKEVHPYSAIYSKANEYIINGFNNNISKRIAAKAFRLAYYKKWPKITIREYRLLVKLPLPGEHAKHAVSEGTKEVTKFTAQSKFQRVRNSLEEEKHQILYKP